MLGRDRKKSLSFGSPQCSTSSWIFLVLAFGLWRLQVARTTTTTTCRAEPLKQLPILAPRGKILDREGRIIVDNYPSFSVLLLRDQKRDLMADATRLQSGCTCRLMSCAFV